MYIFRFTYTFDPNLCVDLFTSPDHQPPCELITTRTHNKTKQNFYFFVFHSFSFILSGHCARDWHIRRSTLALDTDIIWMQAPVSSACATCHMKCIEMEWTTPNCIANENPQNYHSLGRIAMGWKGLVSNGLIINAIAVDGNGMFDEQKWKTFIYIKVELIIDIQRNDCWYGCHALLLPLLPITMCRDKYMQSSEAHREYRLWRLQLSGVGEPEASWKLVRSCLRSVSAIVLQLLCLLYLFTSADGYCMFSYWILRW